MDVRVRVACSIVRQNQCETDAACGEGVRGLQHCGGTGVEEGGLRRI